MFDYNEKILIKCLCLEQLRQNKKLLEHTKSDLIVKIINKQIKQLNNIIKKLED